VKMVERRGCNGRGDTRQTKTENKEKKWIFEMYYIIMVSKEELRRDDL